MAGAVVGQAFLSAFLDVVFDKLASLEIVNFIRGKKLDDNLLQRLKNTLYAVEAVLNDAELKQIKDSAVNKWLDDLKDAVYEADDLLDHVSTEAATRKEASNFFSRFLNFQDREMVTKLEGIVGRLESIFKLKDILGLKESARENLSWRSPSTSLEDGSNIFGRDTDKEAVLKLLLDDDDKSDGKITVIPIVGMGGVGKTTLAQLIYNDDNLKQKFDLQAWACVSEENDILKATKTITEAVSRGTCNTNDINLLHLDLKEKMSGKKFFIVLDDVWIEDYVTWTFLVKPFQYGIKGSKILVTTRSEKVASLVQTFQGYHLKQLSNEDCLLVFANHACLSLDSGENMTFRKIGREIVKKCKGLPLAAQSLGGLLRGKRDIRNWNNILNSNIWEFSENESKIIPALRISYHYLPPYLKRCFVYCSLYPKDYEFDKNELILLWMAEDLIQPPKNGKTLEEVGYEYFDDLASRSFFQQSKYFNIRKNYVMHDLVHDLAISLGGEFYCRSEELGKETKIGVKTRHLSFSMLSGAVSENSDICRRAKFLRSFLSINLKEVPFNNEKAASIILSNLKYLRVLSFKAFSNLDALPDSLGQLIHLRYLDLSDTFIKTLPESLCKLYNLQTLKLRHCRKLTKLPSGMQNLINLRHLDIWETRLEEMPIGMSKLNNLQHLSDFVVGKHEENGVKELGKLSNLQGLLKIAKIENVSNSIEVSEARMIDKKKLEELCLEWSPGDDFTDSRIEMDILTELQPHENLQSLHIFGYKGTKFPKWVGHSSYHNMTGLWLSSCKNCCTLPSLGQLPSLEDLYICELNGLESIGVEFYKNDDSFSGTPFPSLKSLTFNYMPYWEVWRTFESDAFPQLTHLEILNCPRLRGDLPTHLPALDYLRISSCEQLASYVPRFPAIRQLEISGSSKVALREVPLSVEVLEIEGRQVESMFDEVTKTQPTSNSNFYSFLRDCLPESLKTLRIRNCRKLEFPNQNQNDLLASLPLETFSNLNNLDFTSCENLGCFTVSESVQELLWFSLSGCPNFVSFPREGLPAPNLSSFSVSNCDKLKSLPSHMNSLLPNLVHLAISNCPEIKSFPEGGMPPSLRSLDITNCEKLLRSPSLASMDMLTQLCIRGPCEGVKSFPEDGLVLLPASLTFLELYSLQSVETLECKGLLHLTSLQLLTIGHCPKLVNMVGEKLPPSLIKLDIDQCPLLGEPCQTKHSLTWPKISHIRGIKVNRSWIL